MQERFGFGKNWKNFLKVIDESRIRLTEDSLKEMLQLDSLEGKTFLDVGGGSGLFSLSAMRLKAAVVRTFDFDNDSVHCAQELKRRYYPENKNWSVEQGSILDEAYASNLGIWDIVYSWGVLHHTGNMHRALENAALLVKKGGILFISIYNDQGRVSSFWKQVKKLYNANPLMKAFIVSMFFVYWILRGFILDILRFRNPFRRYMEYKKQRGMSMFIDWFDWLGGYPFEVARPEEIFSFYRDRGFVLIRLKTQGGGLGCNEFIFRKI